MRLFKSSRWASLIRSQAFWRFQRLLILDGRHLDHVLIVFVDHYNTRPTWRRDSRVRFRGVTEIVHPSGSWTRSSKDVKHTRLHDER